MAYEVEVIAPSVTPTDASQSSSPVMREEKVVSPYRLRTLASELAKTSQVNTEEQSELAGAEVPATPPAEETVALSPQMAALARKEQALRRREQEFKSQLTSLEKDRAEIEELRQIKARIAAKDFSDIEKIIPYDGYTSYLLEKNAGASPEQQALKKLEAELEDVKRSRDDDSKRAFDAAVTERRNAVNSLVETSEEFVSIKELGQQEAVVQHILDTWEHDDIELSVEQAAKEVEEAILERGKKWNSLSKLKVVPPQEEKRQLPALKQGVKTLTNDMTTQGEATRPKKSFQGMNQEERYAEARRRAEEKIKQGMR